MSPFRTLRARLLWGLGVPLLILQLAVFAAEYRIGRSDELAELRQETTALLRVVAARIDQSFALVALATRAKARALADNPDLTTAQRVRLLRDHPPELNLSEATTFAYRRTPIRPKDKWQIIRLAGDAPAAPVATPEADTVESVWLDRARAATQPFWTEPYAMSPGQITQWMSYVVPIPDNTALQGALSTDLRVDSLRQLLRDADFDEGQLTLLTGAGKFLVSDDPAASSDVSFEGVLLKTREAKSVDTARRANQAVANVIPLPRADDAAGRQRWAASAPIASTGWSLLAIVDEERLLTAVRARLWRQALTYGLGTIAALSLLWWMSGVATRPLIPLGAVARQVAAGDLGARVEMPSRQDEIGRFASVFNRMMDDLQANIAGRLEATAARQAVESELELALRIQKTLLPGSFPADEAVEIATRFLPAKYVAGDFYDHFRLGSDTLVVAVADVSGKGVAAALFMAAARTALRNFSRTGVSPAETLEGVNRSLCAENRHVMFVTAFVGHYHIPSGRLVYANAGHNIPYRVRPGKGADPLGDATGPLLAVFEDARYANRQMQLADGDTLVLYTDGVVEAADAGGRLFGEERLEALLGRHAERSADALCSAVAESVLSYCNGAPQDDVTLLVLRCSKVNSTVPSPAA